MRIKTISVEKLFGIFNHKIVLDSQITIIHGPNGFGKTIILRMVRDLFKGSLSIFRNIPFEKFHILLEDGSEISVVRDSIFPIGQLPLFVEDKDKIKKETPNFTIALKDISGKRSKFSPKTLDPKYLRRFSSIIDEIAPNIERIGADKWFDSIEGQILSIEDLVLQHGDLLNSYVNLDRSYIPEWFSKLIGEMHIAFIEANRLIRYSGASRQTFGRYDTIPITVSTVREYSDEIVKTIQQKLTEYAELSQSLDRSFPKRLMQEGTSHHVILETLQEKLEKLEVERTRLTELGLIDKDDNAPDIPKLHDDDGLNSVLSIYVQDVEAKLSVFEDIAQRLEVFEEILNERFQFKHLRINKNNGFIFTAPNGLNITLDNLSSGEQHELILLYQLLFHVKSGSLILIDEPELSLHVAWQRRFLDDLERITKLRQFDVLVATHSPQIINDRWEWTVALEKPSNDEWKEEIAHEYSS